MLANTPVEGISPDFYVSHPLLQSGKMERREYQDNIFVNVLGKNALVVMPTGLGKTIIAVMLAVERLSAREGSKVVFLAPTKPLAAQHMKTFHDLTTIDPDFLILFTGAMLPDKRKKMWLDATVAFMTPQVLQNDLIAGRYTLADVSLLIFDEAHRAVGDYAYTFIAEKYLQQAACPQVIGITASPGGTQEKIQEVAQNLHVDHVEVKTDQSPDVRPYVHQIKVEFQKVDLPPDFQQVITYLSGELKVLYTYLNKLGILETAQVAKVTRKDLLAARTRVQGVLARPGDID
ncbi:MAG TPA: DEAD/DEAH box helicase, partial [Candidatus Lokiarchaeia archaeon]|nr:DEAD/DEAH box helicase [Candidatus Lokiarchaeia archaeon]